MGVSRLLALKGGLSVANVKHGGLSPPARIVTGVRWTALFQGFH